MKFATIMKEGLEAMVEAGCPAHGHGECDCLKPARDGLRGLDDASVARMDWAAGLEPQDVARIVKALELAEEAADRFGQRQESGALRDLRSGVEDLS